LTDCRLGRTYWAIVANKRVQTHMWAFALPLWAYVLVGFCPMGFCPMGFCPMGFCPTLGSVTL